MIWPQDALILAATKLKTRRIRLFITVFVAGILFVVLAATSLVANGIFDSIESFSDEGLGKRFILQTSVVDPNIYGGFTPIETDPAKVAQVKSAFEAQKKEKTAAAKRLSITYDPAQEMSPVTTDPNTGQEGFDRLGELAQKLFGDQSVDQEATTLLRSALKDIKENYQGVGVYQSIPLGPVYSSTGTQASQTLRVLKDGKEVVPTISGQQQYGPPDSGLSGVESGLTAFTDDMLTDFLLPEQGFSIKDGTIPIVIPYKASEEILGLTPLKSGADSNARLDRIKEVRQKIAGKTFQVCMRNQTSIDRQNNAVQQQNDYALNKDKKTYVKPELMYDVTDQPCQDVAVTRDVRSATTKKYDQNVAQFEKEFGKSDPTQRIVTFKVVGLAPNQPEYAGFSVTDVIKSLLSSYLGSGWYIPTSASSLLPEYEDRFSVPIETVERVTNRSLFVEVSNADAARRLVKDKSCEFLFSPGFNPATAAQDCIEKGQVLNIYPFGSNSLALEEARSGFRKIFPKVLLVVAGISALIMMGTVGKIIADSRRETAVFRAIGAKRLDIAQIYLTYTLFIAFLISVVSIILGWAAALYVQSRYGETATVEAIVSFNSQDLSRKFTLVGLNIREILMLVGVIFAGSMLSAVVPLLTNLRRNPIRDMRDER